MKFEIRTEHYIFTHGKIGGCGSWAFHPNNDIDSCSKEIFWTPGGTSWGEAKKLAKAHFTPLGIYSVYPLT